MGQPACLAHGRAPGAAGRVGGAVGCVGGSRGTSRLRAVVLGTAVVRRVWTTRRWGRVRLLHVFILPHATVGLQPPSVSAPSPDAVGWHRATSVRDNGAYGP